MKTLKYYTKSIAAIALSGLILAGCGDKNDATENLESNNVQVSESIEPTKKESNKPIDSVEESIRFELFTSLNSEDTSSYQPGWNDTTTSSDLPEFEALKTMMTEVQTLIDSKSNKSKAIYNDFYGQPTTYIINTYLTPYGFERSNIVDDEHKYNENRTFERKMQNPEMHFLAVVSKDSENFDNMYSYVTDVITVDGVERAASPSSEIVYENDKFIVIFYSDLYSSYMDVPFGDYLLELFKSEDVINIYKKHLD